MALEEDDWDKWEGPMRGWGRGMAWRIALSIVLFFGLIIFIILWLFFFAGGFNVYQVPHGTYRLTLPNGGSHA